VSDPDDTDAAGGSAGPEARLRALSDLLADPDGAGRAEAAVLEALSDSDSGVRAAACRIAGALGVAAARDRLRELRLDPDPAVSDAATEGLERLDGTVEEPLDPDSIAPTTAERDDGEPEPDPEPSAAEGAVGQPGPWPIPRGTAAGAGFREDTAGPTREPDLRWRVGVSGVPIVGESVYVADAGGVRALDPDDGTRRWGLPTGEGSTVGARPSPDAAVDGTLYLADRSRDGGVCALDAADGAERWRVDADVPVSALTAHRGTVYAAGAGRLYAFDAADGTERWRVDADVRRFGRPSVADGTVFVDGHGEDGDGSVLFALAADDGTETWRIKHAGLPKRPVVGESIHAIGSRGLLALDPATGGRRWRREGTWGLALPVAADRSVYAIDDDTLCALDPDDGSERWSYELEALLLIGGGPCLAADAGSVYVVTDALTAVDAADGTERWRVEFEGTALGAPALADGWLYLGTSEGLCAFAAPA